MTPPRAAAAPHAVVRPVQRRERARAPLQRETTFTSDAFELHETPCATCGTAIVYARPKGQPRDTRRRCCDCIAAMVARERAQRRAR